MALGRKKYLYLFVHDVERGASIAGAGALAAGLPEWLAEDYVTMHVAFSNGIGEHVSSAVRDLTGKPARTFEEFAHDHKKAFS